MQSLDIYWHFYAVMRQLSLKMIQHRVVKTRTKLVTVKWRIDFKFTIDFE